MATVDVVHSIVPRLTAATATTRSASATTLWPRNRHHRGALRTGSTRVGGRRVAYAAGGRGLPVLFLHGWGLDHRAYQQSLARLTARGCRVIAPSLPGFGGSAGLPIGDRSLCSYAAWVAEFLDALDIDEPLLILGHSFGGGVATKFAHDHPDRARYLVLMNSVGATRPFGGSLADHVDAINLFGPVTRALSLTAEGAAERMVHRVVAENFLRDPLAVAHAGQLALTADLAEEIEALASQDVPVLVLWSDRDSVIPRSAFDTFCSTFGAESEMVEGGHSWLLANPDAFGQVLDNVLHVQNEENDVRAALPHLAQLREHLRPTTVPRRAVKKLLTDVSPLWVLSASPQVLAADITLCHPPLETNEVRAVARPLEDGTYRLTVVAQDRAGLLADTTSVLAGEKLRVESASVMTWPAEKLALHSLRVHSDSVLTPQRWAEIGDRLRELGRRADIATEFVPSGRAEVIRTGAGHGTSVVRVTAPDQLGLLSVICRWFADQGISVDAAKIATIDEQAEDIFLIQGDCEVDDLARQLSKPSPCSLLDITSRMTQDFFRTALNLSGFAAHREPPPLGPRR